jgi:hypothetical protein
MQCTSYFNNPTEQALLSLQLREAELRVAREELAFLQACGGVAEADVRRLREGLGLQAAAVVQGVPVVAVGCDDVVVVKEEGDGGGGGEEQLVSLKSVLLPVLRERRVRGEMAQACRRVALALKRCGVAIFRRRKAVHVLQRDAWRVVQIAVQ